MKAIQILFAAILMLSPSLLKAQQNDEAKTPGMETAKTRAVKVDFLSPLTGNLTLGYEWVMSKNVNIDLRLGIIGIGTSSGENAFGLFLKGGPKLLIDQEFTSDGDRRTHPLMGKYIRPEIAFTYFSRDGSDYFNGVWHSTRQPVTSASLLLNYGKQAVVGSKFVFDYHIGVGYAYTSDNGGWYYSHAAGPSEVPVAISAGLLLGFMF